MTIPALERTWTHQMDPSSLTLKWRDSGPDPYIKFEFRLSGIPQEQIPQTGQWAFADGAGYLGTLTDVEWQGGFLSLDVWYRPGSELEGILASEVTMFQRLRKQPFEFYLLGPKSLGASREEPAPEKRMPIQHCGFSLPEKLGREVYDVYVRKFGQHQSYERVIARGGFGLFECILILHGIGSHHQDFKWRLERFLAKAFE